MTITRHLIIGLCAVGSTAHAGPWLVAEAPAAIPVSDAQSGVFRPGLMPAFGVYADRGPLSFGARLRAGVLRNGPAPGDHLSDPGTGGLVTGSLAVRATSHGFWIEGVAGGGVTGRDFVPAMEAGVGWDFSRGAFDFGPSARYVHVVGNRMDQFGSADLVLIGVDVQFGRARPQAPVVVAALPPPPPPVAPAPVPAESDGDRVLDSDEACDQDPDGCPIGEIVVHNDRIVLDERVLFDTDRAHVKTRGREIIGQITALWHDHPEWARMTIEGHADLRGTDEYNQDLSQRRAERVRDVMVKLGITADRLTPVGYGRSRPLDPGETTEAHAHNRRVEFVIEHGSQP